MSFWNTLFMNPIEAFVLIYGAHVFSKSVQRFNFVELIPKFIFLGLINMGLQYIPYLINNEIFQFVFMVIVSLLIMPITLYFCMERRYSLKYCLFSNSYCFITVALIMGITTNISDTIFTGYGLNSFGKEIIVNIIIKLIQFIILLVVNKNEKFLKKPIFKKQQSSIHNDVVVRSKCS